jgi:protein-tyrosine phosphatase
MAEFVMKDIVAKKGHRYDFHIESAATTSEEIIGGMGNPVYPPARDKLFSVGISTEGKYARKIRKEDYNNFDYIIGMDRENKADMMRFFGEDPDGKISLLLDFTENPRDVADPWYTRDFDTTYNDILEGCKALWTEIESRNDREDYNTRNI